MSIIEYYSYRYGECDEGEDRHHLVCEVCEESAPARLGVRAIEHHRDCCAPAMLAALDVLRSVRALLIAEARGGDVRNIDMLRASDVIADLHRDLTPVSAMGDGYPELVDLQPEELRSDDDQIAELERERDLARQWAQLLFYGYLEKHQREHVEFVRKMPDWMRDLSSAHTLADLG